MDTKITERREIRLNPGTPTGVTAANGPDHWWTILQQSRHCAFLNMMKREFCGERLAFSHDEPQSLLADPCLGLSACRLVPEWHAQRRRTRLCRLALRHGSCQKTCPPGFQGYTKSVAHQYGLSSLGHCRIQ